MKELHEILTICMILKTLPEEYLQIKLSWILMSKKDRTIASLTRQFCAHKRIFNKTSNDDTEYVSRASEEAKVVNNKRKTIKKRTKAFMACL